MIGKYKYTEAEEKELLNSIVILVDTREQVNDHITKYFDAHKIPYKRKALENGDYSFYIPKNEKLTIPRDMYFNNDIFVERKANLEELSNNLSTERARFEKELATAKARKRYLLIENADYKDIVNGNYDTKYNKKSFLGTLHSFNHKYDLQLMFMKDNAYSAVYIYGVFMYYLRSLLR